jgi:hypothetical protein
MCRQADLDWDALVIVIEADIRDAQIEAYNDALKVISHWRQYQGGIDEAYKELTSRLAELTEPSDAG